MMHSDFLLGEYPYLEKFTPPVKLIADLRVCRQVAHEYQCIISVEYAQAGCRPEYRIGDLDLVGCNGFDHAKAYAGGQNACGGWQRNNREEQCQKTVTHEAHIREIQPA